MQWQSYKHFLLNFPPYILKSWSKEVKKKLKLYQEKTPSQMFLAYSAENGSAKCNQALHFHPRLHKPVSKVLPMYRYIIAANTYFSGKNFSLTISCFIGGFHRCQKFKYANAIMIASVFKHLPKSEEAIHTCSLKKLFWSISGNPQKSTYAGVSFCVDYIFSLFHLTPTI